MAKLDLKSAYQYVPDDRPLLDTLCSFATFLAKGTLKYLTIKCYLSALRHAQIAHGFIDPGIVANFPRLE